MSEWFKEHAWKACVGETLPRVRIPLSPPFDSPSSLPMASRRLAHGKPAQGECPERAKRVEGQSKSAVALSAKVDESLSPLSSIPLRSRHCTSSAPHPALRKRPSDREPLRARCGL